MLISRVLILSAIAQASMWAAGAAPALAQTHVHAPSRAAPREGFAPKADLAQSPKPTAETGAKPETGAKSVADSKSPAVSSPAAPSRPAASVDASQYCAAIAPTATEVRIAWEMQRLKDLELQIQKSSTSLQAQAEEARNWVEKRRQMQQEARDSVVAIFGKMPAEAASNELAVMDEAMAASILGKLNPRVASGILAEMDSGKAARLNGLLMAAPDGKKT